MRLRRPRYDERMGNPAASGFVPPAGDPGRVCGRRRPWPPHAAARLAARVRRPAQLPPSLLRHRRQHPGARRAAWRQRVDGQAGAPRPGSRAAGPTGTVSPPAMALQQPADRRAGGRAWVRRCQGVPGRSAAGARVAAGRWCGRAWRASGDGAAAAGPARHPPSPADRRRVAASERGPQVQSVSWQTRRAERLTELGFPDLAAYLQRQHVEQGWSVKRMRAELRVGRRWLVTESTARHPAMTPGKTGHARGRPRGGAPAPGVPLLCPCPGCCAVRCSKLTAHRRGSRAPLHPLHARVSVASRPNRAPRITHRCGAVPHAACGVPTNRAYDRAWLVATGGDPGSGAGAGGSGAGSGCGGLRSAWQRRRCSPSCSTCPPSTATTSPRGCCWTPCRTRRSTSPPPPPTAR